MKIPSNCGCGLERGGGDRDACAYKSFNAWSLYSNSTSNLSIVPIIKIQADRFTPSLSIFMEYPITLI